MTPHRRSASPIGPVVKRVLAQMDRQRRSPLGRIQGAWPDVVGKRLALHSRPTSLRKRTLTVKVDQSGWLFQFNLERERVLAQLRALVGERAVQAVRHRIGEAHVTR